MKRRAAQPPRGPYTTPLRQLRRRLTFVFTVLTGTVLTVFLAITLGLAQKQTQLSAQSMFDASVDTLIVTLQTGSVSDTALAQTEAADGLLIFITDNGTPLFFSGGWAPATPRGTLLERAAEDIRQTAAAAERSGRPMHGICAGDITSGDHTFYTSYNEVMSATGIEFRNAMGNHDMKLWGRSHETSAAAFEAMYGPAYYSYNVGEVHYAVLNDNYYIGRDWYYIGYLEERQLAWLERDLSFVPAGTTVVVALHIPTAFAGKDEKPFDYAQAERSLCNHRALHRLLEPYDAHIVSGHMHTTTNCPVREGLYEHNVAALSGAWWQGAICTDGTPAGYAVFEVDGGEVSWYYKSVGHPRSFQLKIYDSKDDEAFAGRIVANVWNCDPAWTVEMRADGGRPVRMERTTAVDPQARRLYADASKLDHKWITVTQSDHYYAAPLPAGTRRVEVTARDRFGNTYRAEKRINR